MDENKESVLIPRIEVENTAKVNPDPVADPPSNPPSKPTETPPLDPRRPQSNSKRNIWIGVGVFIVLFLIYNLVAGFLVYKEALKLVAAGKALSAAAQSKDLNKIHTEIGNTRNSLNSFNSTFTLISWARILPFAGGYVSDTGHAIKAGQAGLDAGDIVLTTIQPYADLLGLSAGSSNVLAAKTGEQTTQDRIDFVVKTIPGSYSQNRFDFCKSQDR